MKAAFPASVYLTFSFENKNYKDLKEGIIKP
jgi:hypothetical protein